MSEQLMSKQELLDKIKQGFNELSAALSDLDDTQDSVPGPYPDSDWTIKDTLAHLTACTQSMISRLPGHQLIPFPVEAEAGESWDSQVERINEYYYQRDKDKPMAQVAAEFGKSYRQLLQEVEALSDAQLADPKVQSLIAGDSYEHYAEHLGYIKDWLEQQEPVLISKTEVLGRMEHGHDQLLAALGGLNDAQMTTPGPYPDSAWTVKDTLAHLAVWMRSMVARLPGGAGKPYPFEEQPDEGHDNFIERVNDYWYQRDKDKPLAEVRSEFEAAYQQLYAAVEALSDEQIAEHDTQYRIGGNTYWHFDEHLGYIGDWLKQQEQPHISKADMLAQMAAGRDELMAAISDLSDAQMISPGPYPDSAWTVKDTLAHLAAWMRVMAVLLRDGASKPYPFEQQPDESEDHFVERVNEYWYQRDKDKPLAEVRRAFEAAYQQQFAAMEALSDEQAVEPTHIKEHLGFISDWLKQQSTSSQNQPQPVPNRAELLAMMKESHDKFVKALAGLSDVQMTSPGPYPDSAWTVKDTLAHCTAWMRATLPHLQGGNGNLFPFAQLPDEDDRHYDDRINAYWRERDKDKSLATVRVEFEAAFQQLLAVVEHLSDAEIAIPEVQSRIGNNSYWHFEGHLGYIGDWLKQQQGQA